MIQANTLPVLPASTTLSGSSPFWALRPFFCSLRINPKLSRKMCLRARICALYGRSVSAGAGTRPPTVTNLVDYPART